MSELPPGWGICALEEIASLITKGTTPTTIGFNYEKTGISFVKIENIANNRILKSSINQFISEEAHTALLRSQLQENDVLFSIAGTIGKTALVKQEDLPANTNQAVAIIRVPHEVTSYSFLQHQLSSLSRDFLTDISRGGAMSNVSLGDIKNFALRIPPLAEQTRIAQKLDELLAQVDTLKARIDAIPALLKRFRQSVLAAAVSGRLTEDWRTLSNAVLIDDYIEEVRLKRIDAWKSSQENSQRKSQYKEADALLDEAFPELPANWRYCSVSEVSSRVTYGLTVRPSYVEVGAPVISAKEIKTGLVDYENANKISFTDYALQREKCKIFQDDILFGKTGTIGSVARADREISCCSSQNIAVISPLINAKFLEIVFRSSLIQKLAIQNIKTTAIPDLQLGIISRFPIPLCCGKEQTEIVRRVEQLFAFADQLEAKVASAKSRIDQLTQSILAKAFRGELVPQDPSDEPASVLLERIKTQRAAAPKAKRGRKASV